MKRLIFLILLWAGAASGQEMKPSLGSRILPDDPINRGLVGRWLMNEGVGNKASNLALPGKDIQYSGTYAWSRGSSGPFMSMDGSDGYGASAVPGWSGDYSIVWQMNLKAVAYTDRFFWKRNANTQIDIYCSASEPLEIAANAQSVSAANVLRFNEWHTYAVVFRSGASCSFYRDGVLISQVNTAVTADSESQALYVGTMSWDIGGREPQADWGAILMSSRALTPSEIQRLYRDPWAGIQQDPMTMYVGATVAGGGSTIPVLKHHYEQMRAGIVPVAIPVLVILSMSLFMRGRSQ